MSKLEGGPLQVQLKQSKKIKPLSEFNFPHFTLESKYQIDKSSYHKTGHNFSRACLYFLKSTKQYRRAYIAKLHI